MTIEVTAKKVDDAINQGTEQLIEKLGVSKDDVKVEVLDMGGLFRKAKVRLTVEEPEKKPEVKKAEPEKKPEPQKAEPQKPAPEHKAEAKPEVKPEAKKAEAKPATKPAAKPAPAQKPKAQVKNEQAPAEEGKSEKSQSDLSSAQPASQKLKKQKKEAVKSEAPTEAPTEAPEGTTSGEESHQAQDSIDQSKKAKRKLRAEDREAASHALEFVKKTVELMGFDTATVSADEDVEHVEITAPEGDDSLLIGRHGETLSALTYLAETCARAEKCHVNIVVDCNGYRARRAASLTSMAKRRARESASKHRKIKLEPMDRTDRRTIHCALADDEYVTTASEGKEPYRYVVITPKDGATYDYDDKKHDRRDRGGRDRNGKGGRGGRSGSPKIETTPTGAKPRFDINLHGFVGHNDPTPEEDVKAEEPTETAEEQK